MAQEASQEETQRFLKEEGMDDEDKEIQALGIQERYVKIPEVGSRGTRSSTFESTYLYELRFIPIQELYRFDEELAERCGWPGGKACHTKEIKNLMMDWKKIGEYETFTDYIDKEETKP